MPASVEANMCSAHRRCLAGDQALQRRMRVIPRRRRKDIGRVYIAGKFSKAGGLCLNYPERTKDTKDAFARVNIPLSPLSA